MSEEIRVLAVRQPFASLIVEGLKTIEVRSKTGLMMPPKEYDRPIDKYLDKVFGKGSFR